PTTANSTPSSNPGDSTAADSARPSDPGVGREAGLDGSGIGGSGSGVGREAGNGRASPGLAMPRPTPLAEFASGGPTRGSSCSGAGSVPNSDMGDSGTGSSGPSGHRPVLEVAGHGRASPRLSTPHQELRPDPASCSLPGTAPDATRGTISGPSPGSSAGSSGSSARRSDTGESSVGGSARRSDLGDSRAGSGGSGPGDLRPVLEVAGHGRASPRLATSCQELLSDLAGCSPPGTAPDAGVGTIHGSGSGPDAGVGTIHGPGSGVSPSSSLGCTCGRGFGPKAQLCVVMDVPYLATNGERGRCEIPGVGAIARSELERLGCDPDIYGILFDQQGLPLYHGRKTRRVSPQQWRVLVARDKGCVICGAHPNWCQAHHVRYWRLGGPTDIDNLVLLCHAHHRWVHDNEITLRHGPNGWYAPTGRPPPGDITGRSARSLAPAR
ncbi:MAG: HNH endonuclease, partial [Acidimicrobiaceae bacterium]|nr:HNH endonuclease [Acidimicrobiaceae bacterium]MYF33245.1 HNH endonuclease [Acidimicrobiaceae bacterium]